MKLSSLYVPTDSQESALLIAQTLINEKLAACANIFPAVTSIFKWEGKLEEASEVVLIIKAPTKNLDKTRKRIEELHPYSIPCIAELEIKSINNVFANWVEESCSPTASPKVINS